MTKIKRNLKCVRVPHEFDNFLGNLQQQYRNSTGQATSKSNIMRMFAAKNTKIVIKKGKIDWRLI